MSDKQQETQKKVPLHAVHLSSC